MEAAYLMLVSVMLTVSKSAMDFAPSPPSPVTEFDLDEFEVEQQAPNERQEMCNRNQWDGIPLRGMV